MHTKLLALTLLCICLVGCDFALFEYTSTMTFNDKVIEATMDANNEPVDPTLTSPLGAIGSGIATGVPALDILNVVLTKPTIDGAKVLSIAVVGDPAAIAAWRAQPGNYKSVTVRKTFFKFRSNKVIKYENPQ